MENSETLDVSFSEVSRALLTHVRCMKYISILRLLKDFKKIFEQLSVSCDNQVDINAELESQITTINTTIADHGFKIDKKNDEISGELYYIFINTEVDEVIKGGSDYSTNELTCIKSIMDEIIESPGLSYSISRINAQQTISSLLNRTLNEAHYLIMKLIDDGWFLLTKNDLLVFSIRSLSELKYYLMERFGSDNFGTLLQCKQCDDIVTMGWKCPNNECNISFHHRCLDIFERTNSDIRVCIGENCSQVWDSKNLRIVGVDKTLIE